MPDDWKPGDLAWCVSLEPHWSDQGAPVNWSPVIGGLYHVTRVGLCRFGYNLLLALAEDPNAPDWGCLALRFRKVTPDEADEDDRETIALMTGQPAFTDGETQ